MIDLKKLPKGPDFTGWLRAPAAEHFAKALDAAGAEALKNLLGAAGMSEDHKVRHYHAEWKTLTDLASFLKQSRKESPGDDD